MKPWIASWESQSFYIATFKLGAMDNEKIPLTSRFIMTVAVGGQVFEGSGASKKLSKQACAKAALTKLYNISFTPIHLNSDSKALQNGNGSSDPNLDVVPGFSLVYLMRAI